MSNECKIIEVIVRVKVPNGFNRVAINEDGCPVAFSDGARPQTGRYGWITHTPYFQICYVENWRDTLTEVPE